MIDDQDEAELRAKAAGSVLACMLASFVLVIGAFAALAVVLVAIDAIRAWI